MDDTQKFTGVDPDKWSRIKAAVLAKSGISIQTDVGAATAKGITLGWIYAPETGALSVTLVKRSFYDPSEETIDTDIKTWVEAA